MSGCLFWMVSILGGADASKDWQQLQGVWKLVSLQSNGQELPGDDFRTHYAELVFQGKQCFIGAGEGRVGGTFVIDPIKKPKTLDFFLKVFEEKYTVQAIYEIKEGTLRICCGNPDRPRPPEFKAPPQSNLYLATFRKVPPKENGPAKIVTLGDSITKGVRPGVKTEETFAHLLQAALKKEGVNAKVVNAGIGGENTAQALKRLHKIIALKPRLVTIMYGTNDSWVDKGKKDSRLTQKEYRANLTKIVQELRQAGITPVLMTEPCLGDKHDPNGAGEHPNQRLEAFMKVCREVSAQTKTPLVDNFTHWTKTNAAGTDIGAWTTDQCHPNRRGHEEITGILLPAVLKELQGQKKEKEGN